MTTKGRLAEQVLRLYNGGDVSVDHSVTLEEVMLLVTQVVNRMIKKEYYDTHYPLGEMIPPRAAIATYEDVAVTPYGNYTSGISCTPVDANGLYIYWYTGSEFWGEEGAYWAITLESINLSITRVISNNTNVYAVTFSGITYPNGFNQTDVLNFINNCASGGAIRFAGMTTGIPSVFLTSGIADVDVYDDVIYFNYTPTLTVNDSAVMQAYASDTHDQLAPVTGTTAWVTDLGNIFCCVDTDNSSTLFGQALLPAQPMNLPNGMGVWRIYTKAAPNNPYIPIPTGLHTMASNVQHSTLAKSLEALTCYEVYGNDFVLFNQVTTALPSTVDIQLVVVDPDEIGEYEMLPVPPEMEYDIIRECLQLLGQTPPEDLSVDNRSETR